MNAATPFEQYQILNLFLKHQKNPKTILIGFDIAWCEQKKDYQFYRDGVFPQGLYDDNPYNDFLYMFNSKALEESARELEYLLGKRSESYSFNGYKDFTPPMYKFDLDKVQEKLYPKESKIKDVVEAGYYPNDILIKQIVNAVPNKTLKIFFFPPYHVSAQSSMKECKAHLLNLLPKDNEIRIIDFMILSNMTENDRNYWDATHYNINVASQLSQLLKKYISR